MTATTAATAPATTPQPTTITVVGSGTSAGATPPIQLPGTSAGATKEAAAQATGLVAIGNDSAVTVPLDAFARRSGPDAKIKTDRGMVTLHAVFQMDPSTKEMSVSLVDETGRLIRMIPPDSVAKMLAAMAAYRGR